MQPSKPRSSAVKKLMSLPLGRYVVTGGITYVFDIGILVSLYSGLHTSRAVAASASFWLGLIFSFLLQKLLAFQDYKKEMRAISRQIFWYAILIVINYFVTVLVVSMFPGRYIVISRTAALLVTTLWNYFIYKKVIFR